MAWIESHQELERHPKRISLGSLMGWDKYQTVGRLHAFWWWCVDYALDGDLSKFNDEQLAEAVGLDSSQAKQFVEAMVKSGWIDREPDFRVHDWWDYVGNFLQRKYKSSPGAWKKIKDKYYQTTDKRSSKLPTNSGAPNLTKPNRTRTKPKPKINNNHNLASETSSLADEKDGLNYFINLFKPVNQNLQDIYPNITERKALKVLLDRHGKKVLEEKIKNLEKTYGQPFCTTITKPSELKRHWDTHTSQLKKLETNSRAGPTSSKPEIVENKPSKYASVKITGD